MEDLGHLEDQPNMALKEEVATKVGKVMVDINMGWSSLDRDGPPLHSVIYGCRLIVQDSIYIFLNN